MVIANSNSSNTLASLDDVTKFGQFDFSESTYSSKAPDYVRTNICLPEDDLTGDLDDALYLPENDDAVDLCLRSIPQVMESADELLFTTPLKHFTTASPERLVYVAQGEVGHATCTTCDVIASDKATTCHILAFRSVSTTTPLVSLTHVDAVGYDGCIRNMVKEHTLYHADTHDRLTIDVYIIGGFESEDARQISNHLIRLVTQMADDYADTIQFILKTCAISSMNDDGSYAPIGRGMGINVATGEAFLCKVDEDVSGPCPQLRAARLWSGNGGKSLSVVATHYKNNNNTMVVAPFTYSAFPQMDALLRLEDEHLLQYTSTSPELEEDNFCQSVRSALVFMGSVPCHTVFPAQQPAVFQRMGRTNQWKPQF
jgi:hypothetical protein